MKQTQFVRMIMVSASASMLLVGCGGGGGGGGGDDGGNNGGGNGGAQAVSITFERTSGGFSDVFYFTDNGTTSTTPINLTPGTNSSSEREPSISNDRARVVFSSNQAAGQLSDYELFVVDPTSPSTLTKVTDVTNATGPFNDIEPSISNSVSYTYPLSGGTATSGRLIVFTSDRGRDPVNQINETIYITDDSPIASKKLTPTQVTRLNTPTGEQSQPAISPNGRYIAFVYNNQIYVIDRNAATLPITSTNAAGVTRVTSDALVTAALNRNPRFDQTSSQIIFESESSGSISLYQVGVGGGTVTLRNPTSGGFSSSVNVFQPSFTANVSGVPRIVFVSRLGVSSGTPPGTGNVFIMNQDGSNVRKLTSSDGDSNPSSF